MTQETKPKFEVVEEATRTTADRIRKEGRRSRREFNGTTMHLALDPRVVEELSQEGHLCFVNDDLKGSLTNLEDIGYRFVTNGEAYGDRQDLNKNDRVKIRYGTADKKGTPQDIYLMLQPWEFYNEDQKAMEEANNMVDKQIQDGGKEVDGNYGRAVKYEHNKH